MAISCRKNAEEMLLALCYAHNALQSQVITDGYHRDLTQTTVGPLSSLPGVSVSNVTVTAASATDLPTTLVLANQMLAILHFHMGDDQVHLVADYTNDPVVDGYIAAVDQTSVNTLLNGLKAVFNNHLTASGVHPNNDTANNVSTANATNLATSEALANALKTAVNAHMANAGTNGNVVRIRLIAD